MNKKIAIATLGCKVNQFESASFASSFVQAGCELVPFSAGADVYVINTCAVTGRAGQQSRQLIRRALKTNPGARLVITGCYAQMAPQTILDLTEQPLCLVGNGNKHLVVASALAEDSCDLTVLPDNVGRKKEISPLPVTRFPDRTRAFLRIQDGCNNFCSYCIVPYTRGRSRSLPLAQVLEQTAIFARQGYREVVITGINVGKYGLDLAEGENLVSLLTRLCCGFSGIRFRLSSVEPTEVDDPLLTLLAGGTNFMPHLHIPLQSGDDTILQHMNRRYRAADFARVAELVRQAAPHAAIGCDILSGFPGETDQAHANTHDLLSGLPVTYLHVFPYSRRTGTLAATMNNQVPTPVKEERVTALRALDRRKREEFHRRHLGSRQQVLVERRNAKTGLLQGFSENYLPVVFAGPADLEGTIVPVRLRRLEGDAIFGSAEQ
ncbi:MAG: tRNA (N(6)-L-threonylcarbamoyladenosine(37)-C(2))-methylthiotransferase MtaB [Desulfobulbaceae bacterium]